MGDTRELPCDVTVCRVCGAVVFWARRDPEVPQYPKARACSCGATGHELHLLGAALFGVLAPNANLPSPP